MEVEPLGVGLVGNLQEGLGERLRIVRFVFERKRCTYNCIKLEVVGHDSLEDGVVVEIELGTAAETIQRLKTRKKKLHLYLMMSFIGKLRDRTGKSSVGRLSMLIDSVVALLENIRLMQVLCKADPAGCRRRSQAWSRLFELCCIDLCQNE